MRILVTGASGWIGSAVLPELLEAGHDVVGLARSDASAARVTGLGATATRGDIEDLGSLRAAADGVDGVVHLGYDHDFSQMARAAATDRAAIEAFGDSLSGHGGFLLIASGLAGFGVDGLITEETRPDPSTHPRVANAAATLALADRGVRSVVVRFAPTVHGPGDRGFVATLADVARRTGVAGWIGDGTSRWPAVHRLDAARLVRLAVESAPAASVLHAVGEEGIETREIAAALGQSLGVPARAVPESDVAEHFGWIGRFFGMDCAASSAATRELLDWAPSQAGLLDDIAAGSYAGTTPHSTV